MSEDEIVPETIKVEKKEEVKPHRCGYCSKVIPHFHCLNIIRWKKTPSILSNLVTRLPSLIPEFYVALFVFTY